MIERGGNPTMVLQIPITNDENESYLKNCPVCGIQPWLGKDWEDKSWHTAICPKCSFYATVPPGLLDSLIDEWNETVKVKFFEIMMRELFLSHHIKWSDVGMDEGI
jgi:hypothetical protein